MWVCEWRLREWWWGWVGGEERGGEESEGANGEERESERERREERKGECRGERMESGEQNETAHSYRYVSS